MLCSRTYTPNAMRNETNTAAHELHELGYHLVPCEFGTKRPLIRWKESECSHAMIDE